MMYYKIINDRPVFSDCRVIELNGFQISNPTQEMISQAGWLPYTPPPVVPTPQTEPNYEQVVDAVKKMLSTETSELSDEDALEVAALFPTWVSKLPEDSLNPKPTDTLPVGYRVWYDDKLYKVVQAHVPQRDWTPDTATSLYTEISIAEWPEFVQPTGVQDAYNTGDKVTFNGAHYICKMDNCTWSPSDYPAGWELV